MSEINISDELDPNALKSQSIRTLLFTLAAIIVFGVLVGSGIIFGIAAFKGIPLADIQTFLTEQSSTSDRNTFRLILLVQHLTMFIIPAFLVGYIIAKKDSIQFLSLSKIPKFVNVIVGIAIFLVSFPLIQYSYWINKLIPLPSWAMEMETSTGDLINNLLVTTGPLELIFNVFIIAIIPGIGEELIFRGLIQKSISRITRNPILAIWITAVVFSTIHFQFQGFIPRVLLGALLGYLFYWTNNLWVPIIAHIFNNGIQVVMQYLYSQEISSVNIDEIESVPTWMAVISIALIFFLSNFLLKKPETYKS